MHCKYCGVEIDDNVKVCPLCHEKLDGYDENAPTVYPKKNANMKIKKKSRFTFNNLYLSIGILALLICITINYTVTPKLHWCWLVMIGEIYGYLFVANTIKSNSSITVKIVVQTIMVFLLVATAIWIFSFSDLYDNPNYWVLNYALPGILGIGNLVLLIFTIVYIKKKPSILIDLIFILFTGYIPIIMYWCKTITILWLAVVVAIISIIGHLCCFAFFRGEVKEEVKKKFHM